MKLIALSLGAEGSRIYTEKARVEKEAFLNQDTIETTGAGDTFCACILDYVLKAGLEMSEEKLLEALTHANAAASLVTTRKGALRVMPNINEIEEFLEHRK